MNAANKRPTKPRIKNPADAATSGGAQAKPGKGSSAKRNHARAQAHLQIPADLRALRQWVVSDPKGRPINARTGGGAMSNNPKTWSDFDTVMQACAARGPDYLPAFALSDADPYCIVDLDDKPDKPASDETRELFDHIINGLDSYCERSRSGRGFHVIVEADLLAPLKTAHVEIYDRAHFVTLTGDVVGKAKPVRDGAAHIDALVERLRPAKPTTARALAAPGNDAEEPDDDVIARASNAPLTGAKFAALHRGEWEELDIGDGSQSPADLAYVGMLWDACGNATQVERLWLASPLAERDKGQRPDYIARMLDKVTQAPPKLLDDDSPASMFSDRANARRIEHHMGDTLLYVPNIGWHVWEGARWKLDPLEARRHVGRLGRIVLAEAGNTFDRAARASSRAQADTLQELGEKLVKFSGTVENIAKVEAAMKWAESSHILRCDPERLDADPYLLGCDNGTVDLRTGDLLPADPQRLISKSTGVAFDPKAKAPQWERFLERIFRSHPELIPYMQRLAGWWLTGLSDPAMLAVLWGNGRNGKSTLIEAIQTAMGEYAGKTPSGFLTLRDNVDQAALAGLKGKRFVVAVESGEDGRLNEERVKAVTGGDEITARKLYQDYFTFKPTHKLAMQTNHKPTIRGRDDGIWRRVKLIPFVEKIEKAEEDPTLKLKLSEEAPGILAWAVRGAVALHANGYDFDEPELVSAATKEYKSENDVIGDFITECCDVAAGASVEAGMLYIRYTEWAEENGERKVSKKKLGMALADRGFVSVAVGRNKLRHWQGLTLPGVASRGVAARKASA